MENVKSSSGSLLNVFAAQNSISDKVSFQVCSVVFYLSLNSKRMLHFGL